VTTRARRAARATLVLAPALAAGCGGRYGAPDSASTQGDHVLGLWRWLFWTAAFVGALVLGLILFALVRYRGRPDDDAAPVQTREHVPLELFYTAVPLVVVAVLFGMSVATQERVTKLSAHPDVRVEVTGFQWQWRFRYPREDITIVGDLDHPPTLVLPVGRTTRLDLVSSDVVHSFYVPAFLEKRDLIPGVKNEIDVRPTRAGRFAGHCAEFCGLAHDRMGFDVRTLSPPDFSRWLRAHRARPAT
jgi:cytochrome c oxidase subunit 2